MLQHELLACAQCGCFAFSCFEDFAIRVNFFSRPVSISTTMERRSSENVDAAIFEYRVRGDNRPLHSSYVKKK